MFSDTVAGHDFLRARFYLDAATTLRLTVAVPRGAVAGFYARRDAPPSFTRHDVFHVVDATKVVPGGASSRQRRRAADIDHTTVGTVHSVLFIAKQRRTFQGRKLYKAWRRRCKTTCLSELNTRLNLNCYSSSHSTTLGGRRPLFVKKFTIAGLTKKFILTQ